jgi:tRNA-dihydrouridine synthase A
MPVSTINTPMTSATARYADSLRLSVAPMMDWTDRHCRVFHRVLAPGARLYTEMVHANAVIHGDRERLLGFDRSERRWRCSWWQRSALLAQAARIAAEWGYDEVNLNCGCPSDRVQAGRFGACLMREPVLVAECVAAMVDAVEIPVTVKCRLGVDEDNDYDVFAASSTAGRRWCGDGGGACAQRVAEGPVAEGEPRGSAAEVRLGLPPEAGAPGTAGGDQRWPGQHRGGAGAGRARRWRDAGPGGLSRPYLLHQLEALHTGAPLQARGDLLRALRPYVEARLGEGLALKHITRHLLGLFHGQPGGRAFRQVLSEGAHRPGAGLEPGRAGAWRSPNAKLIAPQRDVGHIPDLTRRGDSSRMFT